MTLREDARAVLSAWQPTDAVQSSLRKQYLAHLDAHDDAMWRSCHPDHLTASALVMSDDGRYVALTRHRKLGRWLQFGGHCETADASLADVCFTAGSGRSHFEHRAAVVANTVHDLSLIHI